MSTMYGYVRVSTRDQNEARQIAVMEELGIPNENIFIDKQFGKNFNRPEYRKMLRKVKKDDLIYIKSIDRLGRNYGEIIEQWKIITQEKKIDICIIDMPILDTRKDKDLLGTLISDLVLTLLSYVAENERNIIRQRQAEGIAIAKERGVHFGRKPNPLPENFYDVYQQWKMKKITVAEAASLCGIPQTTFFEKARIYEKSSTKNM